jgi:TRAP-type uncharacterized transport system substrate-binding protein
VTKLYNEEMQVIAPKTIKSLNDLEGRTVSVDLPDGGTFVTALTVFERLEFKANFMYIEQRIAMEKLKNGRVAEGLRIAERELVSPSDEARQKAHRALSRTTMIEIALGLSIFAMVGVLGTLHPAAHLVK